MPDAPITDMSTCKVGLGNELMGVGRRVDGVTVGAHHV
jgi:hypothetical protein